MGAAHPLPFVYFYLDSSLAQQSWYFVYRYIVHGITQPPATVGPATSSDDPLVLIVVDTSQPPWQGTFGCDVTRDPMLQQVSLGTNIPVVYGHQ